jgi:hypothetical protein
MITLTNPKTVNNVLGGTATVAYDKFVATSITYDILNKKINGTVRVTCTADSAQTPLYGTFVIAPQAAPAILQVDIPNVPFFRIINLSATQQTTVNGWFTSDQNTIEAGFISIGAILGTQTSGT